MTSLHKIIIASIIAFIVPLMFWFFYKINLKNTQGGFKRKQMGIEISTKKIITTNFEILNFLGDNKDSTIQLLDINGKLFNYSFITKTYTPVSGYNIDNHSNKEEINTDSIYKVNFLKEIHKNDKDYSEIMQDEKRIKRLMAEDGVICQDFGKRQPVIYLNYYTNKFYLFEQPHKLIYKANTIDTLASLPEITFIPKKSMYTYAKTTRMVNKYADVYNGYLFVNSLIKADNDQELMKNNQVIDIYRVKDGKYVSSFYVPILDDNRVAMNSFYINTDNNTLYTVWNNKVGVYNLKMKW